MIPKWKWPDARGWIGIGSFLLAIMVIWIMKEDRSIREDEFFQTIATILIANGWISVVAWGYAATKGGGDLADKNAEIAHTVAVANAGGNGNGKPQEVVVTNKPDDPVPTDPKPDESALPEYARGD